MADNKLAPQSKNKLPWYEQALPMEGRATFLPFQDTMPGSVMNQRSFALPGVIAGAINAVTAPGRAYSGSDPMFDPQEEAANFAMNMLGGGMGASRAAPPPAGSLGMNTWHGSPHRFPPTAKNPLGEFDPMKIGTGEGAQAYGAGAGYLAEAKGTATGYRDTLAHKGALDLEYEAGKRGIPLNREAQVEFMRQSIPNVSPEKAARSFQNANIEARNLDQNKLAALFKDYKESKQGYLYKVDLPDEQIAKMLDWDKPLSKQSKEVQDALARATSNSSGTGKDVPRWSGVIPANYEARSHLGTTILVDPKTGMAVHPNATHPGGEADALRMVGDKGSAYLDELRVALGGEKNVAEFLRKNGISGIRYLDQGAGKGTSNFVVFDPKHMNIIGRE